MTNDMNVTPASPASVSAGSAPAGVCPVCDAAVALKVDTQATEVVSCAECKTKLVVDAIAGPSATLSQAPAVEEDWGQ